MISSVRHPDASRRARCAYVLVIPLALGSAAASAQSAPSESPPEPSKQEADLAQAKDLFQKGNELRKAGDCQRALEFYLHSRQVVASVPNTINAAFCFDQLGRYDEALELYEVLLTDFRAELGETDRKSITSTMLGLRSRLGALVVSSNAEGLVLVDGRPRGRLPLSAPLRLLPGDHTLRVVKDGWSTFEKVIAVRVGETVSIDAKVEQLARSGRLHVEDERLVGADLFIDGTLLGQLPWEGTLAPGSHFYSVRRGDLGSAPREANVIAGQTATATIEAGPLGHELRIVVQPLTADLTINGVPVGKGQWRGALPLGRHTVEAHEPGYFTRTIRSTIDATTTTDIVVPLLVDENHPRWGRNVGTFWVEAVGGYAFASSLDSGAEDDCAAGRCSARATPHGGLIGVRGGYEFPFGTAIELTAAYLTLKTRFTRTINTTFPSPASQTDRLPITYTLRDDIEMSGLTVIVGGSYRRQFTSWLNASAGFGLGVVLAGTKDAVSGTASDSTSEAPVEVYRSGRTVHSAAPFAMPEVRLQVRLGHFTVGAGLGVAFFLVDGPAHETGDTFVQGSQCDEAHPTVDCAPAKKVVFEERAHGTFTMLLPSLAAGYRF